MQIFRYIDVLPETQEGILVDLFYDTSETNWINILDLEMREIINGIVGEVIEEVDPLIKSNFAVQMLKVLSSSDV